MHFAETELLKLRLLTTGIRIGESAVAEWKRRFDGPLTLAEYATTGGVGLILPGANGDLYVNAPIGEIADAPELEFSDGEFVVSDNTSVVPVRPVPVPAFHAEGQTDPETGETRPHTDFGVTHTDRCRVSPISGCAWKCNFCDLPFETKYFKKNAESLLRTILVAVEDPLLPARHVLVSGGTPRAPIPDRPGRPGQNDEAWIDEVYGYLAENSPIPVDVMMPARNDLSYPRRLRDLGVNMLSVNLEVSSPSRAREIAPAKASFGLDNFLEYVESAVDAFGVGFVQSLVVFGSAIEPIDSTLAGIQALAERGCVPVLSPFRSHPATPMRDAPDATLEETLAIYEATVEVCESSGTGVKPGPRCIPCHHNTATLPDSSDFYVGLDGDLTDRQCAIC